MNINERTNQLWLELLKRQDSISREHGTRALQLIGLAGGLLLASLALLDFTSTSLEGAARPALLVLLVGGAITALSGTYLLASQLAIRSMKLDPWDLARPFLFQLITAEDVERLSNELGYKTKRMRRRSGLRWKLASSDAWPLSLALFGLLVEVSALLTLGVGIWKS